MTTIHLILSHEINELLEDNKDKKSQDQESSGEEA